LTLLTLVPRQLLIADEHVGIQGNGNQDVQSWFHSQEINVLVDSASVCAEWLDAINANQVRFLPTAGTLV
jgi:hypothetical protein